MEINTNLTVYQLWTLIKESDIDFSDPKSMEQQQIEKFADLIANITAQKIVNNFVSNYGDDS